MMNEFVPYEQAITCKELGFAKPCVKYWWSDGELSNAWVMPLDYNRKGPVVSAPTWRQVWEWLLAEWSLYAIVVPTITGDWTFKTTTVVSGEIEVPPYNYVHSTDWSTREEAELECLKVLLKLAVR